MFINGIWYTKTYKKNKDGKKYLFNTSKKIKNTFVTKSGNIFSSLFKENTTDLYHSFGIGDINWDSAIVPVDVFNTILFNEIYRTKIPKSNIFYIKYGVGKASTGTIIDIIDNRRVVIDKLAGRVEPDNWFNGLQISITSGTNVGLVRNILAYNQSTGTITVDNPYPVAIDGTSEYEISEIIITGNSNAIQIKTILPFGIMSDAFNGIDIREQSIFGGNNISAINSGNMLNSIRHPKRYKDNTIEIEFKVNLVFKM